MIGSSAVLLQRFTAATHRQDREEQRGVTHHLKSHLEDGSGVEAAEAISTVGGRAPRLGQPARWCSAGELARTKHLDWRQELFTQVERLGAANLQATDFFLSV